MVFEMQLKLEAQQLGHYARKIGRIEKDFYAKPSACRNTSN
jgi:hypothetical protein